jgi:hypothetical protein
VQSRLPAILWEGKRILQVIVSGRGDFVSTVGLAEVTAKNYIRNQEKEDERITLLNLFSPPKRN